MTSVLPDCMMPDGAEPCVGYQQLNNRHTALISERDDLIRTLRAVNDVCDTKSRTIAAQSEGLNRLAARLAEAEAMRDAMRRLLNQIGYDNSAIAREILTNSAIDRCTADNGTVDPVWDKGTPMPEDYTCVCGLYVHPKHRKPKAIHIASCPYRAQESESE